MVLRATTLLAGVAGVVSALSTVTAPAVPKSFWLLQLGRECMDEDVRLCQACCASADRTELEASLQALSARPSVAVEVESPREDDAGPLSWSAAESAEEITKAGPRSFLLPGLTAVTVHELDFADGGTGARVWDAAIALSIWVTRNALTIRGKRVLELGAGTGLSGISAAFAGAREVTLSELAEEPSSRQELSGGAASECSAARLLPNIDANLGRNGLLPSTNSEGDAEVGTAPAAVASCGAARSLGLNWEECLAEGYTPAGGLYDVVLGSDLVYEGFNTAALLAALVAHTAPGGTAYLMSASSRFTRSAGALSLLKGLKAEGSVKIAPMAIHNSYGRTEVVLVTWMCEPRL